MASDLENELRVETYKALFSLGPGTVRTVMLLNGGACLALLAFIGNLAGKGQPFASWARILSVPFYIFVVGSFLCGLAMVLGYVSQLILFNERSGFRRRITHDWPLNAAIISILLSVLLFLIGAIYAVQSFQRVGAALT